MCTQELTNNKEGFANTHSTSQCADGAALHSLQRARFTTQAFILLAIQSFVVHVARVCCCFLVWYGLVLRQDLIQYVAQAGLELRATLESQLLKCWAQLMF